MTGGRIGRVLTKLAGVLLACWACGWVAANALVVQVALPHADAILVLSGAPVYTERLVTAARLFREGRADKLILTDDGMRGPWSRTLQRNPTSVESAMLLFAESGVPAEKVEVLSGRVSSTYQEVVLMRDYSTSHALKSVIVVTSRYHTRRAFWTLRRVLRDTGAQVGIEPATPIDSPPPATWWLYGRGWPMVAGEYVKLAYYWVRY